MLGRDENGIRFGQWSGSKYCQLRIADYKPFTMVDGEGIRNAIYVSGCLFQCPNCWNKNIQGFRSGVVLTDDFVDQVFEDVKPAYVHGLSFLGGEPFLNIPTLLPIAQRLKEEYEDKTIWCWTGYTIEQLLEENDSEKIELLNLVDVLVDGPFLESQRNLNLTFRGSENQRIINVQDFLKDAQNFS